MSNHAARIPILFPTNSIFNSAAAAARADTESWHIISSGKTVSKSDSIPAARHKHSAVIHDDTMWVYGGMTDLNERQDLWRIDLREYLCAPQECIKPLTVEVAV